MAGGIARLPVWSAPVEPARIELRLEPARPGPSLAAPAAAPADGLSSAPDRAAPGEAAAPGVRMDRPDPDVIAAQDDPGNQPPVYPAAALRAGARGETVIRLHISAEGAVKRADVLQSSGTPALDWAAREALSRWRFRPARRHGIAVPFIRDQPVQFESGQDSAW